MRAVRIVLAALIVLIAASAGAAQRTFVSVHGSDGNSCAALAPCRSFAVALANTDPNGELIVLDSGAYGRVTVTQSVTIEAPAGVFAGITVFATFNGIDVNAPGKTVTLRGLSINGQGGDIGINVAAVAALRIDRCRVSNMGRGRRIVAGNVVITDSVRGRDNGHDGIWALASSTSWSSARQHAQPRPAPRSSQAHTRRCATRRSLRTVYGVYVEGGPTATPTYVRADEVTIGYNQRQGVQVLAGLVSNFGSVVSRARRYSPMVEQRSTYWARAAGVCDVATARLDHPTAWPAIASNGAGAKVPSPRDRTVSTTARLPSTQLQQRRVREPRPPTRSQQQRRRGANLGTIGSFLPSSDGRGDTTTGRQVEPSTSRGCWPRPFAGATVALGADPGCGSSVSPPSYILGEILKQTADPPADGTTTARGWATRPSS